MKWSNRERNPAVNFPKANIDLVVGFINKLNENNFEFTESELNEIKNFINYYVHAQKMEAYMSDNIGVLIRLITTMQESCESKKNPVHQTEISEKASLLLEDNIFEKMHEWLKSIEFLNDAVFKYCERSILSEKTRQGFIRNPRYIQLFLKLFRAKSEKGELSNIGHYKKILKIINEYFVRENTNGDEKSDNKIPKALLDLEQDLKPGKLRYLDPLFIKFYLKRGEIKEDKNEKQEITNILSMPKEMIHEIFSFLNLTEIRSMCLVCRGWNNIIENMPLKYYLQISANDSNKEQNHLFNKNRFFLLKDPDHYIDEIRKILDEKMKPYSTSQEVGIFAKKFSDYLDKIDDPNNKKSRCNILTRYGLKFVFPIAALCFTDLIMLILIENKVGDAMTELTVILTSILLIALLVGFFHFYYNNSDSRVYGDYLNKYYAEIREAVNAQHLSSQATLLESTVEIEEIKGESQSVELVSMPVSDPSMKQEETDPELGLPPSPRMG